MNPGRRVAGFAAGAVGVAVAGTAVGIARRRSLDRRDTGEQIDFGSLRAPALTVIADDGVPLHVEVDELTPTAGLGRLRRIAAPAARPVTLVFVHGYALNLDCWHFQRAGCRELVRAVYFDQRSHGRSGRSTQENATFEQLGRDLKRVLDEVAPDGDVILVGHSMGGMSIIAMAEEFPELFGDRVVGVALISTTAGGLSPHRIMLPLLPRTMGGDVAQRAVALLARTHRQVDGLRKVGKDMSMVATDLLAFGGDVPACYVNFVDEMLSATPFEVVAEFFPNFSTLDKFAVLNALSKVHTTILCGTKDKVTSIGHSRKLHANIEGSRLVECEGAGHMVIMERHEDVNQALDDLVAAATGTA